MSSQPARSGTDDAFSITSTLVPADNSSSYLKKNSWPGVIRAGLASVKVQGSGTFASWMWKTRWLVLTDSSLSMLKLENSPEQTVIHLSDISSIERTDLKPYCLLLRAQDKQFYLSLKNDNELYSWHDAIYTVIPSMGVSHPTNFRHHYHVSFEPNLAAFTGLPEAWIKVLSREHSTAEPKGTPVYESYLKREMEEIAAPPLRGGLVRMREVGTFAGRMWKKKWLVLTDSELSVHKSKNAPKQTIINLQDISRIERISSKPYCLLLEAKGKRFHLSLENDEELYNWQDDVYARSPLMGVSNPTNFVHKVHVGFDPVLGAFTGMPELWSKLLTKPSITREDCGKDPQAVLDEREQPDELYTPHPR